MEDPEGSLVFDLMCGMWLSTDEIAATFTYLGKTYSFCCLECRGLFARSPEVYVANLAHEPRRSAGQWCPFQRRAARLGPGTRE
jgi:YHS domain-containing protein